MYHLKLCRPTKEDIREASNLAKAMLSWCEEIGVMQRNSYYSVNVCADRYNTEHGVIHHSLWTGTSSGN